MATEQVEQSTSSAITTNLTEEITLVADQVEKYGYLIADALCFILGGLFLIFLIHLIAAKFTPPHIRASRVYKVLIGTSFILVFAIAILLAIEGLGFQIREIAAIVFLVILVGAVFSFFLLPFLPRLPFKIGHMIEVNGVLGSVDAISSFHTTIRMFDGTMVFIPNPVILASSIKNFHDSPTRRVELQIPVKNMNFPIVKSTLLELASEDERIIQEPIPPVVRIISADGIKLDLTFHYWVKNSDFLSTKSDLWERITQVFDNQTEISMAIAKQEIHFTNEQFVEDNNKPGDQE